MSDETYYCHFHCKTCDAYWNVTAKNVVGSRCRKCIRAGKRIFVVFWVKKIIPMHGNHIQESIRFRFAEPKLDTRITL